MPCLSISLNLMSSNTVCWADLVDLFVFQHCSDDRQGRFGRALHQSVVRSDTQLSVGFCVLQQVDEFKFLRKSNIFI